MIANRRAHGAKDNRDLREVAPGKNEGNVDWLTRVGASGGLLLIGGSSLAHFRLRVAQSHVRGDLLPSFWSLVGILVRPGRVVTVPLESIGSAEAVVGNNAVAELPLRTFDDPVRFPNVAVLQFSAGVSSQEIDALRYDRGIVDLPNLVLAWLAFLWGAGDKGNPLLASQGIPSAAFVEAVYTQARIDLTPGLSSAASCPEAIWQSAKWWRRFYESAAPARSAIDAGGGGGDAGGGGGDSGGGGGAEGDAAEGDAAAMRGGKAGGRRARGGGRPVRGAASSSSRSSSSRSSSSRSSRSSSSSPSSSPSPSPAASGVPRGVWAVRQPAAAVIE